jgi:hypothetical protein
VIRKSKHTNEELNSGQLSYGSDKHTREGGKLVDSTFQTAGVLNYKNMSLRESDYSLYDAIDKVIARKVKVYYVPGIEKTHKVLLEGEKYDITRIDPDDTRTFIYLYLERVNK